MLTLLTATGCRPEAWALCERWMMRQDYTGQVRWVIVDDGKEKQLVNFSRDNWTLEIVWPEHVWEPGMNTQAVNMLAGLSRISDNERLVIIEDDDYYAPDWLSHVSKQLDKAELVGETKARYYNVQRKVGKCLTNMQHSSLCSTAMRGDGIKRFREVCLPGVKFIDLNLWRSNARKYLFGGHRVVGIKGLPGREGIGMGHKDKFNGISDREGTMLYSWIGADAGAYL